MLPPPPLPLPPAPPPSIHHTVPSSKHQGSDMGSVCLWAGSLRVAEQTRATCSSLAREVVAILKDGGGEDGGDGVMRERGN